MHKFLYLLLFPLLACPCFAQTALPDDEAEEEQELRRYSVELIVFAYAEDVATGSELFLPEVVEVEQPALIDEQDDLWSLEGPVPDDSTANAGEDVDEDDKALAEEETDEVPPVLFNEFGERVNEDGIPIDDYGNLIYQADPYALVFFTEDELTMLDTWDRLDALDAYEPLLHVGWAQAGQPQEETDPIPLEDFESPVSGLEGAFTLYLSRYLHLVVDLELAAERGEDLNGDGIIDVLPDNEPRELTYEETVALYGNTGRRETASPLPGQPITDDLFGSGNDSGDEMSPTAILKVLPLKYTISEDRIVASGDVRYYDHPKFGVVAKIERVELEEPGENVDDTDVLSPIGTQ